MNEVPKRPEGGKHRLINALQQGMNLAESKHEDALVVLPASGASGYDIKIFKGRTGRLTNTGHNSLSDKDVTKTLVEMNSQRDAPIFHVVANLGQQRVLRLVDQDLIPSLRKGRDNIHNSIEVEY